MALSSYDRRPDHRVLQEAELTTRYHVDTRVLAAQRAARAACLSSRSEFLARHVLLEITENLRAFAGAGADQQMLAELDLLGVTLDRVPRALMGQLIVSLAHRLGNAEASSAFLAAVRPLCQPRAA